MVCGRLREKVAYIQFSRRSHTIKRSLKRGMSFSIFHDTISNARLNGIKSDEKMAVAM
jgi:hypothetical protein